MSEPTQHAPQEAQTDLQIQTAETAAGPSGAANAAADRPQPTREKSLSSDVYADIKLPENLRGREETFAAFKQLAAELKLPAEAVQKLVQWEADAAEEGRKSRRDGRTQILQRWTQQTRDMFGPAYGREITRALDAAERFGGPELRALLDATGLGSHPAVVKTFHKISQQIGEDESVSGRGRAAADKTFAEALYGKAQ